MKTKGNQHIAGLVLSILIIIAGIFSFVALVICTFVLKENVSNYTFPESTFYYRLSDDNFSSLVNMAYQNEAMDSHPSADMKKYIAVAKYFEAASLYNAYEKDGNMEEADKYQKKMDEFSSQTGELSIALDKIDSQLGITK